MSYGNGTFGKTKVVYGLDDTSKKLIDNRKPALKQKLKTLPHESSFVPAVKNCHDTIAKYPSHMSAQSHQTLRTFSLNSKKDQ